MSAIAHRRTAIAAALFLLLSVLQFTLMSAEPASAALGGLTAFEIDGNTAGSDDWDSGPGGPYDIALTLDGCNDQNDDQIVPSTKLDDPWVTNTGKVLGKGDLCKVWTGSEVLTSGDIIFYFAWERRTTTGEVTVYVPLDSAPIGTRNAGDILVKFEYDDNTKDITVTTLEWTGSTWGSEAPLGANVDAAISPDTSFGEAAVNLTGSGILPPDECSSLVGAQMITETGQAAANPTLKDNVGLDEPVTFNTCGTIVVEKVSTGNVGTFDFSSTTLGSFSLTTVTEGVPVAEIFIDLQPGLYDVKELVGSLGPNWAPEETVTCSDGSNSTAIDLSLNETVTCTFTNVYTPDGSASLTVVKQVQGEGAPAQSFPVDITGQDQQLLAHNDSVGPFTYTIPIGTETVPVTVTEDVSGLDDNWTSVSISCTDGSASLTNSVDLSLSDGDDVTCTITNVYTPDGSASLTVVKQVQGEGAPAQSFPVDITGQDQQLLAHNDSVGPFTYTIPIGTETVPVTVTEDVSGLDDNWTSVSISCTDGSASLTNSVDLSLSDGDDVTCTITNVYTPDGSASLTVVKQVQGEGAPAQSFPVDITGQDQQLLAHNDSVGPFTYTIPIGTETVPVTVTEDVSGLDDNWTSVSISCTDGSASLTNSVDLSLSDGDDVTCTITNVYTPDGSASLTVVKQVQGEGAPAQSFAFTATGQSGFSLNGGESQVLSYPIPVGSDGVPVTVTEDTNLPANWAFTSVSCSDGEGAVGTVDGASASVTLADGDSVTCTYVNTYTPPPGTVVVEKVTEGDTGTFSFTSDTLGDGSFDLTTTATGVAGKDSVTFSDLTAGTYDVAETVDGLDANWSLSSATCSDGSNPSAIDLVAGETVTCTFTNVYTPDGSASLTVVKQVQGEGAPAQSFAFTATGQSGFSLNGGESQVLSYPIPVGSDGVPVTVTEDTNLPANWAFTSVSCSDGEGAVGTVDGASASVTLADGDSVTCTYVNTYTPRPPSNGGPDPASIGDYVWLDADGDGTQDSNESGIAGVTVRLLDLEGTVLAFTTTDANGKYLFDDLDAGTYRVQFVLPDLPGLEKESFTGFKKGGDGALDNDADLSGGTAPIQLSRGEDELTIDAGVVGSLVGGVTVTTSTTVPVVSPDTLPFTGFDSQDGFIFGLVMLAAGGLVLFAAGGRREDERVVVETIGGWSNH